MEGLDKSVIPLSLTTAVQITVTLIDSMAILLSLLCTRLTMFVGLFVCLFVCLFDKLNASISGVIDTINNINMYDEYLFLGDLDAHHNSVFLLINFILFYYG